MSLLAEQKRSLRATSIAVGVLALVVPAAWFFYQQWRFVEWAKTAEGPVCGMPFLAALIGAVLLAAALSFVASCFGVAAFVRLPKPRPKRRLVELLALSLPIWLSGGLFLAVIYGA